MLFKLSNLNSNLALTLVYLNPALNNWAQFRFCEELIFLPSIFASLVCCLFSTGFFGSLLFRTFFRAPAWNDSFSDDEVSSCSENSLEKSLKSVSEISYSSSSFSSIKNLLPSFTKLHSSTKTISSHRVAIVMLHLVKNTRNDSKVCCPLIGQKNTKVSWHQLEAKNGRDRLKLVW